MNLTYVLMLSFIIILLAWYYYFKPYLKMRSFYKWLAANPLYKTMHEIENFITQLYRCTNPQQASLAELKQSNIAHDDFIYGEINLFSFLKILAITDPIPGEIFYDLGSGSGKAVIAAALFNDFSNLYGIELLPALDKLANTKLLEAKMILNNKNSNNAYKSHVQQNIEQAWRNKINHVQFINANFLEYTFSDANIVFINATCFGYQTWQSILAKLNLLKAGTRVIVHTKKIIHPDFKLIHESRELASWGDCAVHVYLKKEVNVK